MDPKNDVYRVSLSNEKAYNATAVGTFAVTEISGPNGQYRLEVGRFDSKADAIVARDLLNSTSKRRRYKVGTSAGAQVQYRTACANESAQADGTATYALVRHFGGDSMGNEVVARFDTLAHAQAAKNTLDAASPGDRRYDIVAI